MTWRGHSSRRFREAASPVLQRFPKAVRFSPLSAVAWPERRRDESRRGSLENPFASIELDGRPTSAEMSLGAAGRSACATSRPEEPAGFHEFRWAGGAHGYRHECLRHHHRS